ncbi:TlpA family protein disulfide reductase [Massilia forsythiae]|nr:TlpA disulfide reductase family protein [Massilia forsythiae]
MSIILPHRRAASVLCLLAGATLPVLAPSAAAAPVASLQAWPAKQPTPPLKLAGLDGGDWDLARLRGKVVVVNFWASWCGPCVAELPLLGALAGREAWRDRVAVVGVNYKESLDAIQAFGAAHPIPYAQARDRSGEAFKVWTLGVMPTTILVDRQGRARWRSTGELTAGDERLQRAIEALLAE